MIISHDIIKSDLWEKYLEPFAANELHRHFYCNLNLFRFDAFWQYNGLYTNLNVAE
jgi:hypothetical protein